MRRNRPIATCAGLLLAGTAAPLHAQAAGAGNAAAANGDSADIVVTAMRREERLSTVPASITALDGASLEKLNIQTTEALSQFTPSLHIYAEAVGSEKYTIRGIGRTSEDLSADPGVAIFLNEVYIPRQSAANLAFFDTQRVEVLRGPQGTLYGKNASAGAVNIITRAPTDTLSGYGEVAYGSFDRITVKAAVSGPIAEDRLTARLAVLSDHRDGMYRNLTTGQSANDVNVNAVRGTLKFTPTDRLTITAIGDWAKSKQHGVLKSIISDDPALSYVFFTNNPVTGAPRPGVTPPRQEENPRTARSAINGRQGIETYGGSLNIAYAANGFDIISVSGIRGEKSYSQEDNGRAREITSYNSMAEDTWSASQEFRFVSSAPNAPGTPNRLSWTLGLYAFHEQGTKQTDIYRNIAPFSGIATFVQAINTDAFAVFGEVRYRVLDRLSLTAGLRYTTEQKKFAVTGAAARIPGITATGPISPFVNANYTTDAAKRWNRFSPRAVLDFNLNDSTMLYASIAKGFKSGGFQGQPPAPPLVGFKPEDVTNYEAGFKAELFDGLRLSASIFYSEYRDLQLQTFDINGAPTTSTANARSKGIELEAALRVSPGFTVHAGASFIDPEYKHYISQQPGFTDAAHTFDRSGKRIGGIPKYNVNVRADYRHDLHGAGYLLFDGSVVAVDEVITEFGTLWANAYAKADASIAWEAPDGAWVVSAWVKNVTDKLYYRGGGPVAKYNTDKIRLGLITDPRTFGVSVRRNF